MFGISKRQALRTLAASAGALMVGGLLTASALAWDGPVQGRPLRLHPGSAAGLYVWHNDNDDTHWHLATTDPQGTSHVYSGTLTTDGQFVNVTAMRLEKDDNVQQVGDGTITFSFHTYSAIDGLEFSILGGRQLTFNLDVDGQQAPANEIYLGRHSANPASDPFSVYR